MTHLNSLHDFAHLAILAKFTFISPCKGEIWCHVSFENLLHGVGNFTNTATQSCRLKKKKTFHVYITFNKKKNIEEILKNIELHTYEQNETRNMNKFCSNIKILKKKEKVLTLTARSKRFPSPVPAHSVIAFNASFTCTIKDINLYSMKY